MPPHLNNMDNPSPHTPSRRVSKLFSYLQNSTHTISWKGKSTVNAPSSGRQSANISAPNMKGKIYFGVRNMKDKSVDIPREGRKAEKFSSSIHFSRDKFGD